MGFVLDQLKNLTAVDSPSGFTADVTHYTMEQLRKLGFSPFLTRKGRRAFLCRGCLPVLRLGC